MPQEAGGKADRVHIRATKFGRTIWVARQSRLGVRQDSIHLSFVENSLFAHRDKQGGDDDIKALKLKIGGIHGLPALLETGRRRPDGRHGEPMVLLLEFRGKALLLLIDGFGKDGFGFMR